MVNYTEWMHDISDGALLSSLSVPGTHNSAASHRALPSVQCQGEGVGQQLRHGVRFLDFRVGKNVLSAEEDKQRKLIVCHAKFPLKLLGNVHLSDVLDDVYTFLEEHKSETVIVSIKQEGNGSWDNDNDEFGNCIWDGYISPNKDRWYLGTDIPTLGGCRGKAILFRRFGVKNEDRKREFGVDAAWWSYNCTHDDRGTLQVQDFCEINSTDDILKKAGYIKELSKAAVDHNSTSYNDPKLFLNFCSGSNFFDPNCWPSKIADGLVEQGIDEAFGRGSGVIVLDYAEKKDWMLVNELIDKNF
jgi:1-phosphatidylinositol phosphodiesterase